ncbi:MAG: SMC-Scp complex subunit ScpB [Ruminococcaceae bacterium]|nr:SMC-Scp complex subunit ScpB [Oscillospiraceae bacterium]
MSFEPCSLLESILFAAGDSVSAQQLSSILEISETDLAIVAQRLNEDYINRGRGLRVLFLENNYQLCTAEAFFPYIQQLKEPRRRQNLSPAALETLAVVAYHQPVTRSSIEFIRGVNSDGPVNKLIERGLIEENGRLDAPGRPILYVTTQEFLRSFGLSSLSGLPDPEPLRIDDGENVHTTSETEELANLED